MPPQLLLSFIYALPFTKLTIFPLRWIIKPYQLYGNWGVNMSAIPLMNLQLSRNQEELERLKKSKKELVESKLVLVEKEHLCLQPALSASTWQGQLAKQFQTVRKDELLESYKATEKQINTALKLLVEKISQLASENTQIEKAIQAEIVKMRKKEV